MRIIHLRLKPEKKTKFREDKIDFIIVNNSERSRDIVIKIK